MTAVSLFRMLPRHVLEMICQFAMPISEALKSTDPGSVSLRTDLFYSLGPEWREVALEHYFKHFTLTLNCLSSKISSTHPLGNTHIPVEKEYKSITAVKICVALRDILSGDAALTLAQSAYSLIEYSSVKVLTIKVSGYFRCASPPNADILASVPTFYQLLMRMFPNVTRIHITKSAREVTDIVSSNCQFGQYLLDLYTKYFDVYTALNLHGSWQGGFTKMYSVVTTMRLFFGDYSEQMFQLIHNCAHSLESLAVHNYRGREAYSIFMDTNDSPVEYTRLRSLKLSMVKSSGTVSRGSGVIVLLPSLTHLDVDGSYAFEDDVLFRATRKTLKYANILVDLHTAAILEKYNVFGGPDYPSICHVKISRISDADDDTRRAGHWAYVSSIARNLKALTVYPSSTLATIVESLSNGPEIQSIQHLTLDSATLVFSSVCCLVQKLPQMSRLTLASVYLDKQYLAMDRYEMHDYVVGKWGVLSSQLRLFHVSIDMCKYDLATCAVLLATVCPGLTCFTSSMRSVDSIYELIVWTAKGEPFSRYTERLERIGFDSVPEGCEVFTAQLAC